MRITRAAAILLLLVATAACGPAIETRMVGFQVEPEANDQTPVPVELVVAYDSEIVPLLLEMTARQWFSSRSQLLLDHPNGLRSYLWELVPGQELPLQRLPVARKGAYAAFVYADYLTPGAHRVRIDPYERVLLRLGEEGAEIVEEE